MARESNSVTHDGTGTLYYWDIVISTVTFEIHSHTHTQINFGPLFHDDMKATPDRNKEQ